MREALARSNHDFVLTAQPRRSPSRKASAASGQGRNRFVRLLGSLLRLVGRQPGRAFLVVGATVLLSATFANALFMQDSRHPAPLFSTTRASTQTPVTARRDAPLPVARPAHLTAAPLVPAQPMKPRPMVIAPARKPAEGTTAVRGRDNIASLISTGRVNTSAPAANSGQEASPAEKKRVTAVQRALEKLGFYTLTVDGIAGAGTRTAIENFERTSKLPVTGKMEPQTLRRLSRQSGVQIP